MMNNPILQYIHIQQMPQRIDYADTCFLRNCFDSTSVEWQTSTMQQKVEALQLLVTKDRIVTTTLILKTLNYCYKQRTVQKENQTNIIMTLEKLINYLSIK